MGQRVPLVAPVLWVKLVPQAQRLSFFREQEEQEEVVVVVVLEETERLVLPRPAVALLPRPPPRPPLDPRL